MDHHTEIIQRINQDLGFGGKITKSGKRLINKDGSYNIIREGRKANNLYQYLMKLSMGKTILLTLAYFVMVNLLFALLFAFGGVGQISGMPAGDFFSDIIYAFFFSAQTFTTVGYGGISPIGIYPNLIATICAITGLISLAITTGLFFGKFSQPRSFIEFSKLAIIAPYSKNKSSLQLRMVNLTDSKIINLKAQVTLTWLEGANAKLQRRYVQLALERDFVAMFPMNWTLVHVIDKNSPLKKLLEKDLEKTNVEIIVSLSGFDENYHQEIHASTSYIHDEIVLNALFEPMYSSFSDEATVLELDKLNHIQKIIASSDE